METFCELILLIALFLPGAGDDGINYKGKPFIIEPYYSWLEMLPMEVHQGIANVARKRGYCPAGWIGVADLANRVREVRPNGIVVMVEKNRPYTPFINCVRCYWWRGWIKGTVEQWKPIYFPAI